MKKYVRIFDERVLPPKYDYNSKFFKGLDIISKKMWPKEHKRFVELQGRIEFLSEDEKDERSELLKFLRESMIGSVDRYWTPGKV